MINKEYQRSLYIDNKTRSIDGKLFQTEEEEKGASLRQSRINSPSPLLLFHHEFKRWYRHHLISLFIPYRGQKQSQVKYKEARKAKPSSPSSKSLRAASKNLLFFLFLFSRSFENRIKIVERREKEFSKFPAILLSSNGIVALPRMQVSRRLELIKRKREQYYNHWTWTMIIVEGLIFIVTNDDKPKTNSQNIKKIKNNHLLISHSII